MNITFDENSKLPSLSGTVNEVIQLYQRGDVDVNALEGILIKDAALSIQVLRIANSPFFGFPGEITSIKEACMILGLASIYNLVTAAAVISHFKHKDGQLNFKDFWTHSFAKGIATKLLSDRCKIDDPSAFVIGLLRDVGIILLDVFYEETYKSVLTLAKEENLPFEFAHKKVTQKSTAELSSSVLEFWRFPTSITDPIREQDNINSDSSQLTYALHLADFLAKGLALGENGNSHILTLDNRALKKLDLETDDIEAILKSLEKEVSDSDLLQGMD